MGFDCTWNQESRCGIQNPKLYCIPLEGATDLSLLACVQLAASSLVLFDGRGGCTQATHCQQSWRHHIIDSDYPTDSQIYCATGGKGAVFNTIFASFKRNWSYLFPSDNITLRVAIVPTQTTTFGAIWPQSGLTWKTIAWDYYQSRLSEQLQSHLEKTEINVKRNYSAPCFRTVRRMGLSNWRTLR